MKILKISILLFLLSIGIITKAQVSVKASIDTSMLLIGDQTKFTIEATVPKGYQVNFPLFADTIIDKLEIVETIKPDTVTENELLKIIHKYNVTSFDSGWYAIPKQPLSIVDNAQNKTDTIWSEPVYFGVMTMPLDTTNTDAIADIKKQAEAPITFKEIMPFIAIGLGVIFILIIAYFIYKKVVRKEKIFVKKEQPKEPAHIIAFKELDSLKEKKLWEKGRSKDFYTELTDIVRSYIENRYSIGAMEMTTEEIQSEFANNSLIDKDLSNELYATLLNADFVKFAKASTIDTENQAALKFAYDFVIKTKEQDIAEINEEQENNTTEEII